MGEGWIVHSHDVGTQLSDEHAGVATGNTLAHIE